MTKQTKEQRKVSKKKRKLKAILAIKNYLLENPCIDCGETDIVVLQFDHVRGSKRASITKMVKDDLSIDTIFKEIAKCEVRCANCHVRKTSSDFGWNKNIVYCEHTDTIKLKDELNEESWEYR